LSRSATTNQDISNPYRTGALALECAFIQRVGGTVVRRVVDENAVFHVLSGVCEVQAVHVRGGTFTGEPGDRCEAHKRTAVGNNHVLECGVLDRKSTRL